jgi:ATP-dependent DNA ligase
MARALHPPLPPMEAVSVDEIPVGPEWQYEPKWDGFRCLAFRDGKSITLQSKSGKPLTRYFPDVVETLRAPDARRSRLTRCCNGFIRPRAACKSLRKKRRPC